MASSSKDEEDIVKDSFTVASSAEDLRYASRIGDVDDVKEILGRYAGQSNELAKFLPAVVGASDSLSGNKAIHLCAANGHLDVFQVLLEHGADINVKNLAGSTPLHYAALTGQMEIVRELIERNAEPVVENKYGKTALDEARSARHSEVAEFLMNHVEKTSELPDLEKRDSEKPCEQSPSADGMEGEK